MSKEVAGHPDRRDMLDMEEAFGKLEDFAKQAEDAMAPNTMRAIKSDVRAFVRWCSQKQLVPLPAAAETVAEYMRTIAPRYAVASLERHRASISWIHRAIEKEDPTRSELVRLAIKGAARKKGRRQDQAEGLTREVIGEILQALDKNTGSLEDLRDAAMLSCSYDTMMRRSEIVAMDWQHITLQPGGDGAILIPVSKTDQEGEGEYAYIAGDTIGRLIAYREVALEAMAGQMNRYYEVRNHRGNLILKRSFSDLHRICEQWLTDNRGLGHGPVWLRLGKDGQPLGELAVPNDDPGQRVSPIWKRLAKMVGLDPTVFSAHSTRIGATQDLTEQGFGLPGIMQAGRWKSPRMAARYGERVAVKKNAMAQLARRQKRSE